jgi:multiple sugar transport system permease protein
VTASVSLAGKPAPPARRRLTGFARLSESRRWAYYLLLPSLLMILAIVLYPTVWGMTLSFREMRLNRLDLGTGFVGFKQYQRLWTTPLLALAAQHRDLGTGALIGEVLLVSQRHFSQSRLPGSRIGRRHDPSALVPAEGGRGHMWALMLDPRLGGINDLLVRSGFSRLQGMVRRSRYALASALVVEIWNGFPFLRSAARGLKAIPQISMRRQPATARAPGGSSCISPCHS